jgi:5-methylcytosine-specific restriction endonuclease McrA
MLKKCKRCQEVKPDSEYYRSARGLNLHPYCKPCARLLSLEQAARNRMKNATVDKSGFKTCPVCKVVRPKIHFAAHRSAPDGLASICRVCRRTEKGKPKKVKVAANLADPLVIEKLRQERRDYFADLYRRSPELRAKRKAAAAKRRHRKKNLPCTLTGAQWKLILDLQGNRCAMCKIRFDMWTPPTKDHVKPMVMRGGLTIDNVQALCKSCNCSKQDEFTDYRTRRHKQEVARLLGRVNEAS